MNSWKKLWNQRKVDLEILSKATEKDIFLELKRFNGFDIIDGAVSSEAFSEQCEVVLKNLNTNIGGARYGGGGGKLHL